MAVPKKKRERQRPHSRASSGLSRRQENVHEATCGVRKIFNKVLSSLSNPDLSQVVKGRWDCRDRRGKSVTGAKLSCHHNRADFSVSSSPSPPLSASFISVSFRDSVSVGIQGGKKKKKRLTMMTKVTGPMKLHMKWLSTLSQHLGRGDAVQQSNRDKGQRPLDCSPRVIGRKFVLGLTRRRSQSVTWAQSTGPFTG